MSSLSTVAANWSIRDECLDSMQVSNVGMLIVTVSSVSRTSQLLVRIYCRPQALQTYPDLNDISAPLGGISVISAARIFGLGEISVCET